MNQTDVNPTIVERFQQIDRLDFPREIDRLWAAASRLKNTIADEVRQGNVPVLTGLAMTSCVAATALGYESFHGEAKSADILTALDPRRGQQQPRRRDRQGNGDRQDDREREYSSAFQG